MTPNQFPELKYCVDQRDGVTCVTFSGGLSGTGGIPLVRQWPTILDNQPREVVLDVTGVTHVAGTAKGLLKTLITRAAEIGDASFTIRGANDTVRQAICQFDITDLFNFEDVLQLQ